MAKPSSLSLAAITILSFWCLYFTKLWHQQYFFTPAGLSAGWIGSWADGAAHLTYAGAFAYGLGVFGGLPIFSGHPFTYSFLADALTGWLTYLTQLPLYTSHTIIGFFLTLFLIASLFLFYRRFTGNSTVAALALTLVFTSGGLGFLHWFSDLSTQGPSALIHPPRQYTQITDLGLEWINPVSGLLIPQRSLLLGLPLGLIILYLCWQAQQTRQLSTTSWILLGLIIGFMPIIHPHTFMVLSPLIALSLFVAKPRFRQLALFFLSATPALPLIILFILPNTSGSTLILKPGWLAANHHQHPIWFWLNNWGLFLPLLIPALLQASRHQLRFTFPFLFWFVAANIYLFQPFDWDNVKIFIWVLIITAPLLAQFLHAHLIKPGLHRLLGLTLFLLLCLSGGLDLYRLLDLSQTQIPMYTHEDLALAEFVKTHTPNSSIFATSTLHHHPIPTLTGRRILMGYPGWLWTYGIDYQPRALQLASLYQPDDQLFARISHYSLDYLVVGPTEIREFNPDLSALTATFTPIYQSATYTIYDLNQPRSQ